MVCGSCLNSKKKTIVLSLLMAGAIGGSYYALTVIHNPILAVTMPIVLSLAPCLVMCGAIGGSMWFVQRRGNKNAQSCSCGAHHDLPTMKVEDKNRELQDSKDHISDLKNLQTDQEK